MKLRVATVVVVILMVLVSFSAISRNVSAEEVTSSSTPTASGNGTANLTAPPAPAAMASPTATTLTSPLPTGILSGQNTYVYNFDTSNEGFTKPMDYTYSDVHWDSTNRNIYILSNRMDPGDERLVHTVPTLDPTSDFTVTARWEATTQGNWQYAFPVFLMSASNTQVLMANSIMFYYASRDSNLGYAPWYYMFYYDGSGVQHNLGTFVAQTNTEYHFLIHYDSSTQILRMEIRSASDVTLIFGQYRIGTNRNDGFTLGQVGAGAHGFSSTSEPATVAWTDDIAVTYASGPYRDAVLDPGDGNVKIGWLASNFNDNGNDGWTTDSGTVTWTSGAMTMAKNSAVHAGTSWYDSQFQFDVTFTAAGTLTAGFRWKDSSNAYQMLITQSTGSVSLSKLVGGHSTTIGSFSTTIALNTPYTAKVVATGNSFELWWAGVRRWSGSDASPPSPITGYVQFSTDKKAQVRIDNVRVWNTLQGSFDQAVSDAGTNRPLSTAVTGTVDAYNQTHVYVRSSPDNVAWDSWTLLKADVAAGISYALPDQERQRYYQLRAVLSSGINGTPMFTSFSTAVGTPTTNPTANTGFLPWFPYVGGMVNAVNQNLYYTKQDIAFQGRGFTLAVVRSYNSLDCGMSGPFGDGWTFSYNEFLTVNGDGSVTWTDGTGAAQTFLPKAVAGTYSPPRGLPDRLIRNPDQTFTLWKPDGSRELYSSAGQLISIVDKNGNQLRFTYDVNNPSHLVSVMDDAGKALTFAWDPYGNEITQVSDPLGRTVNYTYLVRKGVLFLATATDPMGYTETYSYNVAPNVLGSIADPVGKVTWFNYVYMTPQVSEIWLESYVGGVMQYQFREYAIAVSTTTTRTITNARGYTTTLTLNSFGNPTQVVGPSPCGCGSGCSQPGACSDQVGNSTGYAWDGEMNKIGRVDGAGSVWTTAYGFRADLLVSTDPGGNESVNTWSETNGPTAYFVEPESTTTFRGFTTTYAYDSKGNQVASIDPGGNVTQQAYDARGFLNKTVSPRGYTTWYVYNASGWLVREVDPANDVTQYTYDVLGRVTAVTSPGGFVTTTTWDRDSRVNKTTDPLQHATVYAYNGRGDRTSVTDADQFVTRYAYNVTNGRVWTTTDPSGNLTVTNAYDLRNNLVAATDANGHTTQYAYDSFDRLTSTTTPLNEVTTYTYDAAGNRIRRTDGNGATTTYSYDRLERLYQTRYPGAPVYASPQTLTYLYDADGSQVSATGFGYTETRSYDGSDRLFSSSFNYGPFIASVSYSYDADGNRATIKDSSGGTTTYAFDHADRLQSITDPEGGVTSSFYDRDNRPNLTAEIGGIHQVQLYDRAGRLTTIYTNGSSGTIEKITYTYDNAGYRTSETDTVGGTSTTTYAYDQVHRLYETAQGASTTIDTYDAVGNLVREVAGITYTYAYNADNEMTYANQTGGSSYLNTYDANGNRVSWSNGAHGGYVYYSYDYENRLIESGRGIVPYTNNTYSPTGERVSSSELQPYVVTTYYGYDYSVSGSPALIADYNGMYARQDRYTQTSGATTPVEQYTGGAHYAYQADALGSIRRITDSSGNTVDTYGYDAWGGTTQAGSLANPFQYAAMPIDTTDSLYYASARFYDPAATGGHRFLSPDPAKCAGSSVSSYAYVEDDPIMRTDPTGLGCLYSVLQPKKVCTPFNWGAYYSCIQSRMAGPWVPCAALCIIPCVTGILCGPCLAPCGVAAAIALFAAMYTCQSAPSVQTCYVTLVSVCIIPWPW